MPATATAGRRLVSQPHLLRNRREDRRSNFPQCYVTLDIYLYQPANRYGHWEVDVYVAKASACASSFDTPRQPARSSSHLLLRLDSRHPPRGENCRYSRTFSHDPRQAEVRGGGHGAGGSTRGRGTQVSQTATGGVCRSAMAQRASPRPSGESTTSLRTTSRMAVSTRSTLSREARFTSRPSRPTRTAHL